MLNKENGKIDNICDSFMHNPVAIFGIVFLIVLIISILVAL